MTSEWTSEDMHTNAQVASENSEWHNIKCESLEKFGILKFKYCLMRSVILKIFSTEFTTLKWNY